MRCKRFFEGYINHFIYKILLKNFHFLSKFVYIQTRVYSINIFIEPYTNSISQNFSICIRQCIPSTDIFPHSFPKFLEDCVVITFLHIIV